MPLAAIILGAIILDLAFRGTEHEFAQQLGKDFGAGSSFLSWAAAIVILGALGYVPALHRVSTLALGLVIVVMVLKNGGLFQQLSNVITSPPQPAPAISLASYQSSGAGAAGGLLGAATNNLGPLAGIATLGGLL